MNIEGRSQALFTQQVGSRVRTRTLRCVAKSLVSTSASHFSSTNAGVLFVFKKNTAQALEALELHEGSEQCRDYILMANKYNLLRKIVSRA